jgi:hypothetical protein
MDATALMACEVRARTSCAFRRAWAADAGMNAFGEADEDCELGVYPPRRRSPATAEQETASKVKPEITALLQAPVAGDLGDFRVEKGMNMGRAPFGGEKGGERWQKLRAAQRIFPPRDWPDRVHQPLPDINAPTVTIG